MPCMGGGSEPSTSSTRLCGASSSIHGIISTAAATPPCSSRTAARAWFHSSVVSAVPIIGSVSRSSWARWNSRLVTNESITSASAASLLRVPGPQCRRFDLEGLGGAGHERLDGVQVSLVELVHDVFHPVDQAAEEIGRGLLLLGIENRAYDGAPAVERIGFADDHPGTLQPPEHLRGGGR